mmetsp:Transcript_17834/g.48500  ORF Transcript_17834/g.48500 Transcript_17834/m.48500 type:complete len:203 (+) Transcript_17834:814-1422(+)
MMALVCRFGWYYSLSNGHWRQAFFGSSYSPCGSPCCCCCHFQWALSCCAPAWSWTSKWSRLLFCDPADGFVLVGVDSTMMMNGATNLQVRFEWKEQSFALSFAFAETKVVVVVIAAMARMAESAMDVVVAVVIIMVVVFFEETRNDRPLLCSSCDSVCSESGLVTLDDSLRRHLLLPPPHLLALLRQTEPMFAVCCCCCYRY